MNKPMGTKTTPPLTFRAGQELRAALDAAAKQTGLTVGEWVRKSLTRALKRAGVM